MANNHLYTDPLEQWWILALEGDNHAFYSIHRALFDGLYGYALKLLQDPSLAGDAVQELFVKIWVKRESIGVIQKVKPYLFTSLRRQVLNQLRDLRHNKLKSIGLPEPDIDFSPEEIVVRNEEYAALQGRIAALLNTLPQRQKEAIYLHYFENMEYAQIAEVMGINYQSVLNLTQKAIQRLRSADLLPVVLSLSALYRLYMQNGHF